MSGVKVGLEVADLQARTFRGAQASEGGDYHRQAVPLLGRGTAGKRPKAADHEVPGDWHLERSLLALKATQTLHQAAVGPVSRQRRRHPEPPVASQDSIHDSFDDGMRASQREQIPENRLQRVVRHGQDEVQRLSR
jgi:hypothetical protein